MDAKKRVREFISPNVWVLMAGLAGFVLGIALIGVIEGAAFAILMLSVMPLFVGLFAILPGILRTNITLKHLERAGTVEAAAKELNGEDVKILCKNRAACTEHFLFVRRGAYACAYTDILWVHKQKFTRRFLMIPIQTTESAVLYTAKGSYSVNLGGKDKKNELAALITEIYRIIPVFLWDIHPKTRRRTKNCAAEKHKKRTSSPASPGRKFYTAELTKKDKSCTKTPKCQGRVEKSQYFCYPKNNIF